MWRGITWWKVHRRILRDFLKIAGPSESSMKLTMRAIPILHDFIYLNKTNWRNRVPGIEWCSEQHAHLVDIRHSKWRNAADIHVMQQPAGKNTQPAHPSFSKFPSSVCPFRSEGSNDWSGIRIMTVQESPRKSTCNLSNLSGGRTTLTIGYLAST